MKYRKRPVVIEALAWTGDNAESIRSFVGSRPGTNEPAFRLPEEMPGGADEAQLWAEREGCWMRCPKGHLVIRGVSGEFYPHDPDVFAMTYEPANSEEPTRTNAGLLGPLVGASAVILRGDRVLLGRRIGAHGAGSWAFPGGKPRPGEDPASAVAREVREETGLVVTTLSPIMWTSDIFPEAGLHYVTLHYQAQVARDTDPQILEPAKCAAWEWFQWDQLPTPLFLPAAHLVESGWRPVDARQSSGIADSAP